MIVNSHNYFVVAIDSRGERLGELQLDPDLRQVVECVHVEGMRRGKLATRTRHGSARVVPRWEDSRGEPHVAGLEVLIAADDGSVFCQPIPWSCLTPAVQTAAAVLIDTGKLQPGQAFTYTDITAFPRSADYDQAQADSGFSVEEVSQPLPVVAGQLASYLERSVCRGAHVERDIPVFIHEQVLEEAEAIARAAGHIEVGGVLIGHPRRDEVTPELFIEVTAQITARHTRAGETRLTFTQDTWAAAQGAIELRRRHEIMLGWWHLHPYFCRDCPPQQQSACTMSRPFFSLDDRALHAAVFGRGFDTALLLTDTGKAPLSMDLFGWRDGSVAARGFHVLTSQEQAP